MSDTAELIKVLIDISPLQNANAIRGVGVYTRFLVESFQKLPEIKVFTDAKLTQGQKINITHYPFFDLFFATLPLKKKTKTVVTIHDVVPLLFPKQYPAGIKGKLRFGKQRLALRSVDAIITDSESSKKDIIRFLKVPEAKVRVVYLAANPNIIVASEEAKQHAHYKYHLPNKYILYVGDINYNKNLPQLIKAMKFLPDDIWLVCVGKNFYAHDIPEWKAIETQVALSDVTKRTMFLNEISGAATEELSAIYSSATMYVQPSLAEGFGLPVLEAMQCKVPVVATKNSSLTEIGGEFAQYVQTDAESIAAGMKVVLDWTEAQRTKQVNAAAKWSSHFSWDKVAQDTLAVYQSILK